MSLLPINPADFPDVPTRKALIAIDFQNDFLADDGALPVKQADGMVHRIIELAQAVRSSGYGEIVWVRSQFETSRTAGDQQIMAADTPQLPTRTGSAAAARMPTSSPPSALLEADPEAFLSLAADQDAKTKPQCVRKGTRGVELLPAIAAAKGPRDYSMTKSYYSAFQTGQLLNLLRRQFATELYICGSLSNVGVYATALAASSHGFNITIVEDCCGFRSEMRHMNAARKLIEQAGCEFTTAADVISTLRPSSSSSVRSQGREDPSGPPHVPPELIAAAMAGHRSKGIPVRPRPAPPPTDPARSTEDQQETGGAKGEGKTAVPSPPVPPQEIRSLEKLKLSSEYPEPGGASEPADKASVEKTTSVEPKNGPSQPKNEPAVQPVVTAEAADAESADAQEHGKAEQQPSLAAPTGTKGSPERYEAAEPRFELQKRKDKPAGDPASGSGTGLERTDKSAVLGTGTTIPKLNDESIVSEERLMAPTPKHLFEEAREHRSRSQDPPATSLVKLTHAEPSEVKTTSEEPGAELEDDTMSTARRRPSVSEQLCGGDTSLTRNFLPSPLVEGLFERLCEEVHFKKMIHQGGEVPRFVAVQGQVHEDGTEPVYRHPSDESPPLAPFTPAVEQIRQHVATALGHPVNHVLIQCYRNGQDHISEHSDKTLDIFWGSYIAIVSVGAERTMVFRQKRGEKKEARSKAQSPSMPDSAEDESTPPALIETPDRAAPPPKKTPTPTKRETIRCPMPHNSLIKMGLATNEKWLHGIRPDKRPQSEKSPAELAWDGARISLTFRYIGTFLRPPSPPSSSDEPLIWGQGATSKAPETARPVINGQTPEAVSLLRAFGRENSSPDFDWEANYGAGSDVLHMKAAPRYFGCGDGIVDGRVKIMLAECGVKYARGGIGLGGAKKVGEDGLPLLWGAGPGEIVPVRFVVDDADRTTVVGCAAILLYLDSKHPKRRTDAEVARMYTRFYAALALEHRWKDLWARERDGGRTQIQTAVAKLAKAELAQFEAWAAEVKAAAAAAAAGRDDKVCLGIAGGADPSVADYALWPVLHDMAVAWRTDLGFEVAPSRTVFGRLGLAALETYYAAFASRKSVRQVFGEDVVPGPRPGVDEDGEAVVEQLLPGTDDVPQLEGLDKK